MKKEKQIRKNEFSIAKINRIISKINKTGLILIVVCYIGILTLALGMVGQDISYVTEPNYEHQFYNNTITPQISIVSQRLIEDGELDLRYSVSVNIAGRLVDEKDPKYKISGFRMFASTKAKLEDKLPNSTYYFTEHTTYSTPITHTFSVNNNEKGQHPSTFYVRLQFEKDGATLVETFKEDIFLNPTAEDIQGMQDWYVVNEGTTASAANINSSKGVVGVIEFQSYPEETDGKATGILKTGLRIQVKDKDVKKFHIDAQSWVVTTSGEYLPFIGVYNYTGPSLKYTNSLRDIDEDIKPDYIVAKVVYRDENNKTEEVSYFKQKIDSINDTFLTDTQVGNDAGDTQTGNRTTFIVVASVAAVALVGVVVAVSYVVLKKKEEK